MSDKLFFPLILVLSALMILLAIREDSGRLPTGPVGGADTDYSRVVIEGVNLNRITRSAQSDTALIDRGGTTFLRISAATADLQGEPVDSTHFRLAADLETQFSGYILRVVVTARSADTAGAQAFEANYSAGKAGNSGWRTFNLTPDFESYSFETRVPIASGQGVDYFGIRPAASEEVRALEIESIVFERLKRWDTGDGA